MYLDPESHAAFTGAPVHGTLRGTILQVVPRLLIVQSWRSASWKDSDLDSTLILTFWPDGEGTRIDLVHVNVADQDFAGVSQGWEIYYFAPWREYLKKRGAPG
jgi:uncharacterized protein YndB with AHSA1/START domain